MDGCRYGMSLTQEQKDWAAERRAAIMNASQRSVPTGISRGDRQYLVESRLAVYNAAAEACEAKDFSETVSINEILENRPKDLPETAGGWTVFDFRDRILRALHWLAEHNFVTLEQHSKSRTWEVYPLHGSLTLEEFKEPSLRKAYERGAH